MTGAFVGLVYGFCAGIADYAPQPTLLFGYQSAEACITVFELTGDNTDDQDVDVVASGHTIHWRWLEGGVEVSIDDQKFVIIKSSGI